MKIESSEFEQLFVNSTPFIDVRAPIEFNSGAMMNAVNLPLLSDDERHQIGIIYKQQGSDAAVALGHRLVSGNVKQARLCAWLDELRRQPNAIIYCFRGGLRSQIVQSWLAETGVDCPIVRGGYKALRRYLLDTIAVSVQSIRWLVIDGPTGSGKTRHLRASGRPFLDLERLACHRGSAFGATHESQPNQAQFENNLAVELLRLRRASGPVLIENESLLIGKVAQPQILYETIKTSEHLTLEVSFEERVEAIFQEYIVSSPIGTQGAVEHFETLKHSIERISRRLGGLRAQEILNDLETSRLEFIASRTRSVEPLRTNKVWIRKLLQWYYDPLYRRANPK